MLLKTYACYYNKLNIFQTKGELSSERKEKFEAAQNAFQKLLSNTQQFAVRFFISFNFMPIYCIFMGTCLPTF